MLTSKEKTELADARVKHLREKITNWLAETGTSEAVLSKGMGLSPTGIRDFFLKERTYPKIGFLVGAAHMLGCTVGELIGDDGAFEAAEIDAGLMFGVIEHVLMFFEQNEMHLPPPEMAELLVLIYGEIADTEPEARHEKLVETTENVIRLSDRRRKIEGRHHTFG